MIEPALTLTKLPALIHVAAAGENRGRVVLAVSGTEIDDRAISAAIDLARTYGAAVDSLLIESADIFRAAAFGFVRHIMHSGAIAQNFDADTIDATIRTSSRHLMKRLQVSFADAGIAHAVTVVRDDASRAIHMACADAGPWNMLVPSTAVAAADVAGYANMLLETGNLTGIWLTPQSATDGNGPIAIALDDADNLPQLVRTAERLRANGGRAKTEIVVFLSAAPETGWESAEGAVRLALATMAQPADRNALPQVVTVWGGPKALMAEVTRRAPRLLIAQCHALVHPGAVTAEIDIPCPLLLVR